MGALLGRDALGSSMPDAARNRVGGYDARTVGDFEAREAYLLGALTTLIVDREAAGGGPVWAMDRRTREDQVAAELFDNATQFEGMDARVDACRAIHARAERGQVR